jgi:hypothetical protein
LLFVKHFEVKYCFCILYFTYCTYGRKCEGVSRNEGSKELSVFHFWRHLSQTFR